MQDSLNAAPQPVEFSDNAYPTHQNEADIGWRAPPKAEDVTMHPGAENPFNQPSPSQDSRQSSPISQTFVELQPPTPKMTIIEEAEYQVNALNSKLEVHANEKALAQSKIKECNASLQLYQAQFALANQRLFEVNMEVGRAKNALAMARRAAKSIVDLFTEGRQDTSGTAFIV